MLRLAALLLLCAAQAAWAAPAQYIRIAISRNSPALSLKTSAKLMVQEVKSGQKFMLLENATYEVKPFGRSIAVAGQDLSSPVKLLVGEGQERVRLGGHLYKGDIVLRANEEGKLDIIEYVSLEDYLYGVLPVEMSPDWPLEALKAQAVASRTYALRYINPSRDYDVSNGVEMQVYKGTSKANARIIEAVDSTRGEVLKFKGKLVTSFFHACCGGHTASSKAAWGEDIIKPLYGVKDPFCSPSRHYRWEYFLAASDLLKFVQASGSTALRVDSFKIYKKDRSGRAVSFLAGTDRGPVILKAKDTRSRFGTFEFRSTYITSIIKRKGGFEVSGKGWGHGVGMCQEGAKQMAYKGKTYKKILHHYYPGAAIVDYE